MSRSENVAWILPPAKQVKGEVAQEGRPAERLQV